MLSLLEPSRLRATLDGLIEGLQVLGPEWRYLYVNEAVARHGKKPREELLGRTMLECYPGIEQTEAFATLERCMRERRAGVFENEFVYEDGSRAWFEIRVEPCTEGIAILSLDITDRKRLEQEVRRADRLRALGEMAAGVAHDLRNILNPLVLQLELLRRRHDEPDAVGIIGRVARVLRDGNEIVDRLHDVARLEPAPPTTPIDPDPIAGEAIELARLHASSVGAPVEVVDETGGAPPIRAAAAELRSALLNLLINAIDAMPAGGRVALRTGVDGSEVSIEVADNGPGMPPEVEERALDPFFTTKGDRGTGLGLATVYAFVARVGGSFALRTAPTRGTTVTLRFPRAANDAAVG